MIYRVMYTGLTDWLSEALLHNLLLRLITGDDEIISSRHIRCLKVRFVNQMGKSFITFIDLG